MKNSRFISSTIYLMLLGLLVGFSTNADAACKKFGGNTYICDSVDGDPSGAPDGARRFDQTAPYGIFIKSGGAWKSTTPGGPTLGTLYVPRPVSTEADSFSIPNGFGSVDSGSYTDTYTVDQVYHQIAEEDGVGSAEQFDARYGFSGLLNDPVMVSYDGKYDGTVAHNVLVYGRNFDANIETGSTTTSATNTTITRTGAAWVVDDLIGSMVKMSSGPANTEIRKVLSNTIDTITVTAFTTTPTAGGGDTYDIAGTWLRLTGDAQDIPSSSTDINIMFLIPGDRGRFRSSLNTFEFRISHDSAPTTSHTIYVDAIELIEEFMSLAVSNVNYTITGLSEGESENTTINGTNGTITVLNGGLFAISVFFSLGTDIAMDVHGNIFINDVLNTRLGFMRSQPAGFGVGSMSTTSIVRLLSSDIVEMKLRGSLSGVLFSQHGGISVVRVGN